MPEPPIIEQLSAVQVWENRHGGPVRVDSATGPGIIPWAFTKWYPPAAPFRNVSGVRKGLRKIVPVLGDQDPWASDNHEENPNHA